MKKSLIIATRESRLALWQAEHVKARLEALYPEMHVELLKMTTRGDQILDKSLSKIGGKGLFIKELEKALLDGRADLAVHSLKDVPVDLQSPFMLSTVLERGAILDAFVSNQYASLDEMPTGAIVGTSSLRREAQIRLQYPHLVIQPLRGNLDTRLAKLDRGEYDAIILAQAGLERLGLKSRIRSLLTKEQSLPAVGQGALGIEILESRQDLVDLLAPLNNESTFLCTQAERAFSKILGGSCQVPIAGSAHIENETLVLNVLLASPDGKVCIRSEQRGDKEQAQLIGERAAQDLIHQGAQDLLKALLG